jgi:hypothetical protein
MTAASREISDEPNSIAIFALGVAVGVAQGCASTREGGDGSMLAAGEISITKVESWQLSDLYESVRVVPLESSDDALFADVCQTISNAAMIFVRATTSDNSSNAAIWQFDANGKFIRQIGGFGEGPGEYYSIGNIVMKDNTLYAFDEGNQRMILYNAETGEYLSDIGANAFAPLRSVNSILPIPGSTSFMMSSNIIFGDDTYGVAECNPITGGFHKILPQKFNVKGWSSFEFGRPTLSTFTEKEALAIQPLNDTIYGINYNTLQVRPVTVINTGKSAPKFADGEDYERALDKAREQHYNQIRGIYASDDYLILNRTSGSVIWNLSKNKSWHTLNGWKASDATSFPFFPIYIVEAKPNNTFVCAYDPESFSEYNKLMSAAQKGLCADMDADANYVLVFYKLK